MLGDNVEWPLCFIEALSSGPNVTMEGNDGRVEKAVWRIAAGTQVLINVDVAHLHLAGAMTKILNALGTKKNVFEEAIAASLSDRWAETGGVKAQVLGVHIEAARKDNSKGGDWAMLEWTDVGLPPQNGGAKIFASVDSTALAEAMCKMPLTFAVVLGMHSSDYSLRFEASIVKRGAVGQTMDFGSGYDDALTRAQRAKDTGQKKATELLDSLLQDLGKDGLNGSLFRRKLGSVDVCLKALDRPELKELQGELNSIKKLARSAADLAIEVGKAAKKGGQQRTVAKKKMIHMDDEYSAEVLLVDDKNTLGWNDVRVKLTGARQRLIVNLAAAPEVRVYQLKDFLPLKELLTALGKAGTRSDAEVHSTHP